jgi:hypothetical protein
LSSGYLPDTPSRRINSTGELVATPSSEAPAPVRLDYFRVEIETIVGFEATSDLPALPSRLSETAISNPQLFGNKLDELGDQSRESLMPRTFPNDLKILAAVVDVNVTVRRDRIHKLFVESESHIGKERAHLGYAGQTINLIERGTPNPRSPRERPQYPLRRIDQPVRSLWAST